MSAWIAGVNQMAAVGLAALLNTLWYGGAVVLLTWAGLRCWSRVNAATRYWIWTAVLASLIVLPFLPGLVRQARSALEARPQAATATAPLASVPAAPVSVRRSAPLALTVDAGPRSRPWPLWLLAAWLTAAGWQLTRLLSAVRSVRRLKTRAGSHGERFPSPWASQTRDESQDRIRRGYQLLVSEEITSPVAVGYCHPAIIVPPELLARLDEGEKRDVLLHELAHLARYDDWMTLVTRALGAILALHPLAALVIGQIEREREMACDDYAVARTGSARSYARSLAKLHDLRWSAGTRLLAPGILGRNSSLLERMESLLRRGRKFSERPSRANLGLSTFLLALLLGAGGLIPGWIAIAQTRAKLPISFEVASIRPGIPNAHRSGIDIWPGGRFDTTNERLAHLIEFAYEIKPEQIEGLPGWARSRTYTIQAVPPPGVANVHGYQRRQMVERMLQSLLANRFKLKWHRITKRMPVYEIVVAKGGSKLRTASKADYVAAGRTYHPGDRDMDRRNGEITGLGVPVASLAEALSRALGRTVIDRTGLTGSYDFTLKWTPWRRGMHRAGFGQAATSTAPDSPGPSIFTALRQQLGLKLKPARGPVEMLVVDHVEPPTPN